MVSDQDELVQNWRFPQIEFPKTAVCGIPTNNFLQFEKLLAALSHIIQSKTRLSIG